MGKRNIEDGFTLPERRRACRATDVPVSTKEYRRLRAIDEGSSQDEVSSKRVENVVLDQIRRDVVERVRLEDTIIEDIIIEGGTVARGRGPKAAKASALREHNLQEGFRKRIEQIGHKIADEIIDFFQKTYTLQDLLGGNPLCMTDCGALEINDISVPSIGGMKDQINWIRDEEMDDDHESNESREDMRKNFLYELQLFVKREVNKRMRKMLKVELEGKSVWDEFSIAVKLINHDPKKIDTKVFLDPIKE